LCFKDIIFPFIKFQTPELQNLLSELSELCVNPNDNSFERHFILGGVEHTFAMGGVHSVNEPEIFEPQEDEILEDVDVDSMYPSIIVSQKLYPQHLGDAFTKVYSAILFERLEAKRNGNTLKNETLKLSVNGLSGNLQSEYS
jgi:DNA polymerase elongation subunit (family B)